MAAVLICDEQVLFGEALAAVLRRRGATAVAVPDLETLVRMEDAVSASHVVLGVDSVRPPSARDIAGIRHACPQATVICLGAEPPPPAHAAYTDAADIFLSKRRPLVEVVKAVLGRAAPAGRPATEEALPPPDNRSLSARFLTGREREVLGLLVAGESTLGIARRLGVTRATARSHIQAVLGRLGVHSRVEAVRYALFHDLVALDPSEARGERTPD